MKLCFRVLGFAVLCLLLLASCATAVKSTVDYSSPVYSGVRGEQPAYTYLILDEDLRNPDGVYTIPFTENAVEVAKATKTMRVYFMAGDRWLAANGVDAAYLGDSTLVVFPDGQTMLIDGGRSQYAPLLIENLHMLGIEKLDYILLSHMHNDHYGVLFVANGILSNFPVETFIWNGSYNMAASIPNTLANAERKYGFDLMQVKAGDSFYIGDVRVDIYNPDGELAGQSAAEGVLNNSSIAAKFTYGDFKSLFCGDLHVLAEWNVIHNYPNGELDVDLLKANHHGTDSSNSLDWAEATTPRVVYSVSMPGTSTYYHYSKVGGRVFAEFRDDYVRVVTDGYNCEVTVTADRENKAFAKYDLLVEKLYPGTFTKSDEN